MLIKPKQVKWQFIRYDDYTISLIKTDMEIMDEKKKKKRENEKQKTKELHSKKVNANSVIFTENADDVSKKTVDNIDSNEKLLDSQPTEGAKAMNMDNEIETESFGVANGKHLALKLQFTLPSSCYATTALRELLYNDSSYKAQVELNDKFSKKDEIVVDKL